MRFVISTTLHSPRLDYIARWIFEDMLHSEFIIVPPSQKIAEKAQDDFIINYSPELDSSAQLNIFSHPLLTDSDIRGTNIKIITDAIYPYFFENQSSEKFDLPFDIFSLTFYLLSRYEEYLPSELDKHSRYKSSMSLAFQNGFLNIPLADLWVLQLKQIIEKKSNSSIDTSKQFTICPTIDIDLPYAYRRRPLKKIAALMRDITYLRWSRVNQRLKQWHPKKDPFDTYQYLLSQLSIFPNAIWFFLCQFQKPFDENHLVKDSLFQDLIRRIQRTHNIGIHPSYSSDSQYQKVKTEMDLLQKISEQEICKSRQHFLKMKLPDTYRTLVKAGISEDHSMMYPDQVGFRASTCHPFRWYDLKSEKETQLQIYSPCIMDVTLKDYLNLSTDQAISVIDALKMTIKNVGGNFEFIWHNSSFSRVHGWKGWKLVFEHLLSKRV